jgi:hypothetical protein
VQFFSLYLDVTGASYGTVRTDYDFTRTRIATARIGGDQCCDTGSCTSYSHLEPKTTQGL